MRALLQMFLVGTCVTLVTTGVSSAEEILAVKFPQGYRQACSVPVIGHFTAQGPGSITIRLAIVPYKSLGWNPNVPIRWRSSWWAEGGNEFAYANPLPNVVATRYTQSGKETGTWVDGIPLEIETTYELETDETYIIDVQGNPQCWAVSHRDYDYWQEGQELRVEVFGGSIAPPGDETKPDDEPPGELDLNGGWETDFGSVILWQDGTAINGSYDPDENGTLEGTLEGNVLSGYWAESASDEECATEMLGSRYWGRIRWTFSNGAFSGAYGYCDADPVWPWNGTRP